MTNLRLLLLATTALTAMQLIAAPSHAQTAPQVMAQAKEEEGKPKQPPKAAPPRPAPPAARPALVRGSCVPAAQQEDGQAQGEHGPGAQHGECCPGRQRIVAVGGGVGVGDLRILDEGLLDGERRGRGEPQ